MAGDRVFCIILVSPIPFRTASWFRVSAKWPVVAFYMLVALFLGVGTIIENPEGKPHGGVDGADPVVFWGLILAAAVYAIIVAVLAFSGSVAEELARLSNDTASARVEASNGEADADS